MRATPSTGSTTAAKGKEREETPLNVTLDQVQAASDKLNDALKASPMPSSITGNIGRVFRSSYRRATQIDFVLYSTCGRFRSGQT